MTKTTITILAITVAIIGLLLISALTYVSYSNTEIRLRNQITAVQKDNESRFDNLWKKISQAAQVTDAQKNALKEIFVDYARARTTDGGGAVAKWIQESVPHVDTTTFNNLQNIIVGSRDAWTSDQTRLIDLKREHDNIRTTFPGSVFVGSRPEIQITVITSAKTERVFQAAKDDDVALPLGK